MKYWSIIFLFFITISSAYSNEAVNVINEADLKFKSGEIQNGEKILMDLLSDSDNLSYEENAIINNKIAWFYEVLVGNYKDAQRYSRKVIQFSLPASNPAMIEAKTRVERLKQYDSKYSNEIMIIRKMQRDATDRVDAKNKIKELKQLIKKNPEYPDISVAYHYVGKHYLYLEKYYKSYKVLSNVLKIRPGIIYLLPTESLMNKAKLKSDYYFLNIISKSIIIISLIIISVLLFLSKFWEWMNLKSLIPLPFVIISWAFFIICSSWALNFFIPDQKHLYLSTPSFIQANPFSPGSGILLTLFYYGILGIICSFLITLATRSFNWPKIRIIANSTVLILFTGSLFTTFYLNNCYTGSIFEKRTNSLFPDITGHTYLPEQDYEPLILTNPAKYPNLSINNTTDKILINWVNKQYSIIASQSIENNVLNKGIEK